MIDRTQDRAVAVGEASSPELAIMERPAQCRHPSRCHHGVLVFGAEQGLQSITHFAEIRPNLWHGPQFPVEAPHAPADPADVFRRQQLASRTNMRDCLFFLRFSPPWMKVRHRTYSLHGKRRKMLFGSERSAIYMQQPYCGR